MKENEIKQSAGNIEIIGKESLELYQLSLEYATSFWAGTWKELLIDGEGVQYGTYDQNGEIYQETLVILKENGLDPVGNWPAELWKKAGRGEIVLGEKRLSQFWSLERADQTLKEFVSPISEGGYEGEIMVVRDEVGKIVGFTAYTVLDYEEGPRFLQKRFPYDQLRTVLGDLIEITTEELISEMFPEKRIGIFLDFAVCESSRGKGLGSQLFDARLERMSKLGAEVVVGRTIRTSPAQYFGNYMARGMEPIALDPANSDKAIFAVECNKIINRRIK